MNSPIDFTYAEGPFGGTYLHQYSLSASLPLGARFSAAAQYAGTYGRKISDGSLNSQWLRLISLGYNLGPDSSIAFELRQRPRRRVDDRSRTQRRGELSPQVCKWKRTVSNVRDACSHANAQPLHRKVRRTRGSARLNVQYAMRTSSKHSHRWNAAYCVQRWSQRSLRRSLRFSCPLNAHLLTQWNGLNIDQVPEHAAR